MKNTILAISVLTFGLAIMAAIGIATHQEVISDQVQETILTGFILIGIVPIGLFVLSFLAALFIIGGPNSQNY